MKRFIILACLLFLTVPAFAEYTPNQSAKITSRQERDENYMNLIRNCKYFENIYRNKFEKRSKYNVITDYGTKKDYYNIVTKPNMEIEECLKIKWKNPYNMPYIFPDKSYYDANPKLEDIIKSRRIPYLWNYSNGYIYTQYDNNGNLIKIGHRKVKYNEDGSLYKIGFFKVKYDKESNCYWNGLTEIKLNSFNEITSIKPLDLEYESEFIVYDTLELYEYYLKMLSDEFFNKYKYYGPRYDTYKNFFELKVSDNMAKIKYDYNLKFAKFFRIYLDYIYNPSYYDNLTHEEKLWFLAQVVETQNWMKSHTADYKNPYEEKFKKQVRTVVKNHGKRYYETNEEILKKEVDNLHIQLNNMQRQQQNIQNRQNERIKYIDGQQVQYDSNGRIYSIGGKRVQY